jgi:PKD repeat protein
MLPAGVTLTPGGRLSGNPAVNAIGNYDITLTASNDAGSATQSFTLTITHGSIQVNAVFPPVPYLPAPGMQYSGDFLQYVASSPLVNGVNPALLWSMVDNGPGAPGGQYNWSVYDAVIQPYIDLGKTVNLLIWPISVLGPSSKNPFNQATPAYVMNLVDAVTCTAFPGNGTQTGGYPVVWEPGFEDNYEKFITEVLSHFQNNPNIGYIRFGLAKGADIYPSCDVEQTPYLPPGQSFMQAFLGFDQDILSHIRSQNPPFPVIAPMAAYENVASYADTEAANGIANGFGIGSQGLRASDITSYPACSSDWCGLFAEYSSVPFSPLFELQPVGLSDPSATCTPSCLNGDQQQTGPLPPLLSFGVTHLANVFEIYAIDLLVALDPNYPGYTEYHAQYQAALSSVHSGIGSSVTLSPSSLNFGQVPVETSSASQTITLTNSGSTVLTFSGISTSGNYSEIDNCVSQSLGPGQQCTISVVFTPSATGNQGGLLWINDSDPWSPQSAGLAGTGL